MYSMKRLACFTGALFGGLSAMAVSSSASELTFGTTILSPVKPGQFYSGIGGHVGVRNGLSWNSATFIGRASFSPERIGGAFDPSSLGAGPSVRFGYALRPGVLPQWAGEQVRVELLAAYGHHASTSRPAPRSLPASTGINIVNINGAVRFSGQFGAAVTTSERLKVNGDEWQFGARVASDHPVSRSLTLTTSLGVGGGFSVIRYDYTARQSNPGLGFVPNDVSERLTSHHVGGSMALGLNWQATPWLSVNLTGKLGVNWRHSRLRASDCVIAAFTTTSCAQSAGSFSTSVSDAASTVGVQAGISAGVRVAVWRAVFLRLNGYFIYDSATPGVNNPSGGGQFGPGGAVAGVNIGSARVAHRGGYVAGGLVMLVIPFN